MGFGKRTKKETSESVAKRIAMLDTHEFIPWIENCVYQIGRAVTEHARDPSRQELLDEALNASEVCTELITELRRRSG